MAVAVIVAVAVADRLAGRGESVRQLKARKHKSQVMLAATAFHNAPLCSLTVYYAHQVGVLQTLHGQCMQLASLLTVPMPGDCQPLSERELPLDKGQATSIRLCLTSWLVGWPAGWLAAFVGPARAISCKSATQQLDHSPLEAAEHATQG